LLASASGLIKSLSPGRLAGSGEPSRERDEEGGHGSWFLGDDGIHSADSGNKTSNHFICLTQTKPA
jgi:hypothetical protein